MGIIFIPCFSGCSNNAEFRSNSEPTPTADTLYAMTNIFAAQRRDSECEAVMKRIISEYPEFLPVYNDLAELQMRQGRTNEAIATINCGLNINPKNPMFLNNLGMCWLIRMGYANALEMFTRAAGIMPENTRYRANMAVALSLMGRYEESLSLFEQVLEQEQANHNVNVLQKIVK
jgi:Flp pilus assembly protein TadD